MFCTNTACCADDLIVVVSSPSLLRGRIFVLLGLLHHLLTRSITTSLNSVGCSIRTCSPCLSLESRLQLALLLFLPAVGTALFLPAVGTALFFMGPRVPSLAVFFSYPSRPSVPCSSVHISRRRLRSGCFVLPARAAYFFFGLFPG